jgi:hypothetical protein
MPSEASKGNLGKRSYHCIATERPEERRTKKGKNSPELLRWRWSDGELADEDPISPSSVRQRKRTGGVEDEEAKRQ